MITDSTNSKPPILYLIISHDVFKKVYLYPQTFSGFKTSFSKKILTLKKFILSLYRTISKMKVSLNCIFLGMTTLSNSFTVPVGDENDVNGNKVEYHDLKIRHLKFIICQEKKIKIDDYNGLNLWKVACNENLEDIITEEQIKIKGKELVPINLFSDYFSDKNAVNRSLIIVQVPATTGKCLQTFYLSNKKFAVETMIRILVVTFVNMLSRSSLELGIKRITEEGSKKCGIKTWYHT